MNTLERALIEKAGNEHGWELIVRSDDAAVVLASARHGAQVCIKEDSGGERWMIAVPTGLIAHELARTFPAALRVDGSFAAPDHDRLARLLRRAAELAQSLPNQAALTYAATVTSELVKIGPCTTEVERLVKQRVGQDTFRAALMDYWGGACAVTGLDLPEVLRASHAKPWADCASDEERLDVFNGLLLCANLDALFDRGLITFDNSGRLISSSCINASQRQLLGITETMALRWIASSHQDYLAWHNAYVFVG